MDISEEFRQLSESFQHLSLIPSAALPEIDLYMDQLTTFMEEKLKDQRRYPEDKILTKTMINNYTKNKLLPPPVKKKYSQDHLITLMYTYYLKSILSISDISTLLGPMTEEHWDVFRKDNSDELSMKDIYEEVLQFGPSTREHFLADIRQKMDMAGHSFESESRDPQEQAYLQQFSLCTLLAFDIYLKKQMMERIIDNMRLEEQSRQKESPARKSSDKKKK